ncbi:hypothetical protein [Pseudolysinimonas sp.]|uniref:hypothetical protein n=1 Tax=Pseudolysinimonas sp. TaxID=2680009 RepID=UPI003F807381
MAQSPRVKFVGPTPIGKLLDLFATLANTVDGALPVKFVDTLAELNAIGLTDATRAGTLATLAADSSGLAAGASFVLKPDGKWYLTGACTALNVDTFVAALSTNANIKTLPGAVAWNMVTSNLVGFSSTAGAYGAIALSKQVSGTGTVPGAIAVGSGYTTPIVFPVGSFAALPSNIIVTCDNGRLLGSAVTRTKDGFTLQLYNWSNGTQDAGTTYYWTAIA